MFFSTTLKSDWFFTHKVIQSFMIALLIFTIFAPVAFMPEKEAEALTGVEIALGIGGLVALAGGLGLTWWIHEDNQCKNCGEGKDSDHFLKQCTNCQSSAYVCPSIPGEHSHKRQCAYCLDFVWGGCPGNTVSGTPGWNAAWAGHLQETCQHCKDPYQPCTESDKHGEGKCDDDDEQGSLGCSSGCCSAYA